jgi:hypothetical protein
MDSFSITGAAASLGHLRLLSEPAAGAYPPRFAVMRAFACLSSVG